MDAVRTCKKFLAVSCVLSLAACGLIGDLGRNRAEALLAEQYGRTTQHVEIDLTALQAACSRFGSPRENQVSFPQMMDAMKSRSTLDVSNCGDEILASIEPEVDISGSMFDARTAWAKLRVPVAQKISVTGITAPTSGGEERTVEFVRTFGNIPAIVKLFAYKGTKGRQLFRRYDDGWRIVHETLQSEMGERFDESEFSNELAPFLRKAQLRREEADRQRIAAERAATEAKRAFDERFRQARTPTNVLGMHYFLEGSSFSNSDVRQVSITLTDVGIEVGETNMWGCTYGCPMVVLFADMDRSQRPITWDGSRLTLGPRWFDHAQIQQDAPEYQAMANAINQSFANWADKNSILVAECGNSKNWGC